MYLALILCAIVVYLPSRVKSLPPDACFQPFKWQDCGRPPQPVMYYWRSGSRCEVGFWRGCVPNLNMFKDEHECVATCIHSPRARPFDYHSYNAIDYDLLSDSDDEEPIATPNIATDNATDTTDLTQNGDHTSDNTGDTTGHPDDKPSEDGTTDGDGKNTAGGGGGGGDDDGTTTEAPVT